MEIPESVEIRVHRLEQSPQQDRHLQDGNDMNDNLTSAC